ncbi:hypothetical protein [Marinobacter sp.]|uniref:hypothetical protein n=1 Tax=Marinobacter sp. TaxID=50741 RepID=UPI003850D040
MSVQIQSTTRPVPSSILHNSTDVRSQYTRMAAAQVRHEAGRKLQAVFSRIRNRATWQDPAMPES